MSARSVVAEHDRFGCGHIEERFKALFPPVTGLLETAKRQFDAAASAIGKLFPEKK